MAEIIGNRGIANTAPDKLSGEDWEDWDVVAGVYLHGGGIAGVSFDDGEIDLEGKDWEVVSDTFSVWSVDTSMLTDAGAEAPSRGQPQPASDSRCPPETKPEEIAVQPQNRSSSDDETLDFDGFFDGKPVFRPIKHSHGHTLRRRPLQGGDVPSLRKPERNRGQNAKATDEGRVSGDESPPAGLRGNKGDGGRKNRRRRERRHLRNECREATHPRMD